MELFFIAIKSLSLLLKSRYHCQNNLFWVFGLKNYLKCIVCTQSINSKRFYAMHKHIQRLELLIIFYYCLVQLAD